MSGAAGNGLDATIKRLRRTPSGASVKSLGTATKDPRGAARIGLGTTIKHLATRAVIQIQNRSVCSNWMAFLSWM